MESEGKRWVDVLSTEWEPETVCACDPSTQEAGAGGLPSGGFKHDPATEEKRAEEKNKDRKGEGRGAGRERNNYGGILLLFEEEYSKEIP